MLTGSPSSFSERALGNAFKVCLLALLASYALVAEERQRNWLLYGAALVGFGCLSNPRVRWELRHHQPTLALSLLLLFPCCSLLWSTGVDLAIVKDRMVAAIAIAGIYLGLFSNLSSEPVPGQPSRTLTPARLHQVMLLAAMCATWLALGYWWLYLRADAPRPRFEGALVFHNPVHGTILLASATLPLLFKRLRFGPLSNRLERLLLPLGLFSALCLALLGGARMATGAYLCLCLAMALHYRPRLLPWLLLSGVLVLAGTALLVGERTLLDIWFSRGLSFRLEIWSQVRAQAEACSVLLGCGLGTPLTIQAGIETGDTAHSLLVALLYHQGLLGMIVYCIALGTLLRRGWLLPSAQGWVWMVAFALLANLTSGDQVLVRATLFWPYYWLPILLLSAFRATPGERTPATPL